jgi:uncharacterized membrane protein HdeD (DUF308 family)
MTTIFLAQLWGPALLAVALGIFFSAPYYRRIYRELEKDALAVLLFGMTATTAGIAHVLSHNVWDSTPEIVVSLLGWGLLLKGLLFIIAPGFVDRAGDRWAKLKMIPLAGALTLLVGLYLTWFAYLA